MRKCVNGDYFDIPVEELAQMAQVDAQYWADIPYDIAVNEEIRKRYTESAEFAILRQKDEKPEEYAAYYAYCEECKARVKDRKGTAQ